MKMRKEGLLRAIPVDQDGKFGLVIKGIDWESGRSGIDSATETLQTIEYEHHEIHSGSHYFLADFQILNDTDEWDFCVTTPNTTKWAHMTFIVVASSQTEFLIYEAATCTGGTPVTPLNNDRNSSNTSDLTVVEDPTVSVAGNLIYSTSRGYASATPSGTNLTGVTNRSKEIILKQNTTYVFRMISRDDGNVVSYEADWYEHTNKN